MKYLIGIFHSVCQFAFFTSVQFRVLTPFPFEWPIIAHSVLSQGVIFCVFLIANMWNDQNIFSIISQMFSRISWKLFRRFICFVYSHISPAPGHYYHSVNSLLLVWPKVITTVIQLKSTYSYNNTEPSYTLTDFDIKLGRRHVI